MMTASDEIHAPRHSGREARASIPVIPTGLGWLDALFGGGLPHRLDAGGPPRTSVLLRGPAESGKSLLAAHIAAGIARFRACDVAYLHPTEDWHKAPAFASWGRFWALRGVYRSAEVSGEPADTGEPRGAILQCNPSDIDALVAARAFLTRARSAGFRIGVMVFDALADTDLKLFNALLQASQDGGFSAIVVGGERSSATHMVDTVLDVSLRWDEDAGRFLRGLRVSKCRLFSPTGMSVPDFTLSASQEQETR